MRVKSARVLLSVFMQYLTNFEVIKNTMEIVGELYYNKKAAVCRSPLLLKL